MFLKLTDNAEKVLENRILRKDENGNVIETPEEMVARVGKAVAGVEADPEKENVWHSEFCNIMDNLYFLPNSPCLANAGTDMPQLQACFVLPIEDSMESIFGTLKDMATVFKSGGGVGFALSKLRPNGDIVHSTGGASSGPVSFLEPYNAAINAVKQGGRRRGAGLASMNVDHPDILDFVDCKRDSDKFNNFNISVAATDKFMQAVKENKDFDLVNPRNGEVVKTVPAKEIWSKLIEGAWRNGEPGILFIDRINEHNPLPELGDIEAVNACSEFHGISYESCLTGDSLILTPGGVRNIGGLLPGTEYVLSTDNKMHKFSKVVSKGVKPVYQITLSNSLTIKLTNDHLVEVGSGKEMKRVKDIVIGDKIRTLSGFPLTIYGDYDKEYEMYGWMHGDGWFTHNSVGISFNHLDKDTDTKDRLLPVFHETFGTADLKPLKDDAVSYQLQTERNVAKEKCLELGFVPARVLQKELPTTFNQWSLCQQISFMRGLFAADGSTHGRKLGDVRTQISLATSSIKLAEQVQKFLSAIGIQSRLYTSNFKTVKRNPQHRLKITKKSANTFMEVIGMAHKDKDERFQWSNYADDSFYNVVFIDYIGEEEVFDIVEVEQTNTFYANGIPVHNCNLGSINLSKMITTYNKIGSAMSKNEVNWSLLRRTAHTATRFLDNVIDATEYPLEQIEKISQANRKIGLGVMGWGDMLYKLGIPYNSNKALDLAYDVMNFVGEEAFRASADLAEEKGVFPNYHSSPTFRNENIKVRNASLTSIAPTGTLSMIAGCTSGIEPAYGLVYTKTVMDGTKLYEINPVFEQELKSRGIYSEELLRKIADNHGSCRGIAEIPNDMQKVFVVAHDIDPEWHVKMQAVFQKNVGMGISKTANLPHSATKEDVDKVYKLAYDLKCKGVTVYRDGSRDNQVLSTDGAKEEPIKVKVEVRKRPTETSGITTALKTGCGKLYATVNEDDNGICEIFLNQKDGNGCRVAYNNALAMVMSMALRAGVPVENISKALKGQSCGQPVWEKGNLILSCPDAIGKLLDKEQEFQEFKQGVLVDKEQPTKAISKRRCPSCGGELISQGGCQICRDCGMERCGS